MAKREAENQMTKDSYDDEDRNPRPEDPPEPPVMASKEVMAGRKIAKPRSRVSLKPASMNAQTPDFSASKASESPAQSSSGIFGGAFKPMDSPMKSNPFGGISSSSNQLFGASASTPFSSTPSKPLFSGSTQPSGASAAASQSEGFSFRPAASTTPKAAPPTTPAKLFGAPITQPTFSSIPTFMSDDRNDNSTEAGFKTQHSAAPSSGLFSAENAFAAPKTSATPSKFAFGATTSQSSSSLGDSVPSMALENRLPSHTSNQDDQPVFGAPASTKGSSKTSLNRAHDPTSLEPPSQLQLSKADMPEFNFLFQIRSLNQSFAKQLSTLLEKDPMCDLTQWIDFYKDKMKEFDVAFTGQRNQAGGSMNIDESKSTQQEQTSPLYPKLPDPKDKPASIPSVDMGKPANASMFQFGAPSTNQSSFGGAASSSLFSSASQQEKIETKPSAFDAKPPSSNTSLFSAAPKPQESSAFGSSQNKLLKPATSMFNFNSNASSATPSNAASPGGSVLDSGTVGMASGNDGGWKNPFSNLKDNPMFLNDTSDKSDDDDDDDEQDDATGSGEQVSSDGAGGRRASKDTTSTPAKPGMVGFLGSRNNGTPKDKDFRWTPDKPISFGQSSTNTATTSDSTTTTTSSAGSKFTGLFGSTGGSAFGAPSQSGTKPPGLFGSSTVVSAPSNTSASIFSDLGNKSSSGSSSIFSFGGSKPNDGKSIFGGGMTKSVANQSLFASTNSPAPSSLSTPGDTSEKNVSGNEGGEESNEPSDEAGQGANSASVDLSGAGPGEEDEDTVFDIRSSIYNLENKQYVKIGVGRLRVLHNRVNRKGRVVVKVETGKVLMNVALRKDMSYNTMGPGDADKVVKILEVVPGEQGRKVWVMKVGKAEDATALRKCMEKNKG